VLDDPEAPAARVLLDVADGLVAKGRGLSGMQLGLSPVSR